MLFFRNVPRLMMYGLIREGNVKIKSASVTALVSLLDKIVERKSPKPNPMNS